MNSTKSNSTFTLAPIGCIRTPYAQKFAVPRQPGLVPEALCLIEFYPPYNDELAFEGIEGFSHIHILFVFDRIEYKSFRPKVRPPRLGGNISVGVFATRSPFRPNRIGLSTVKLNRVIREHGKVSLEVSGADLVDGTPIIDIKPYIPFVDSIPNAAGGFARQKPVELEVSFEASLKDELIRILGEQKFTVVEKTLAQDPRPAYKDDIDSRVYQAILYDISFYFTVANGQVTVIKAQKSSGDKSC
ncbi:MAG: tRNA (N6-threonylcarbamoyladenosine(37)-N6)-methyltransferase TrmO [Succinivibrio sp.]